MKSFEDLKETLIKLEAENPNNMELGQKVRDIVWTWRREAEVDPNQTKMNLEDGSKSN